MGSSSLLEVRICPCLWLECLFRELPDLLVGNLCVQILLWIFSLKSPFTAYFVSSWVHFRSKLLVLANSHECYFWILSFMNCLIFYGHRKVQPLNTSAFPSTLHDCIHKDCPFLVFETFNLRTMKTSPGSLFRTLTRTILSFLCCV